MRYIVNSVSGMGVGGGMFVVWDCECGMPASRYFYWKDEAQTLADRLNRSAP